MIEVVKQNITEDTIEYAHKEINRVYDMNENKFIEEVSGYFELKISRKDKMCRYSYFNNIDGIATKGEKDLAEVGWELMEELYKCWFSTRDHLTTLISKMLSLRYLSNQLMKRRSKHEIKRIIGRVRAVSISYIRVSNNEKAG